MPNYNVRVPFAGYVMINVDAKGLVSAEVEATKQAENLVVGANYNGIKKADDFEFAFHESLSDAECQEIEAEVTEEDEDED